MAGGVLSSAVMLSRCCNNSRYVSSDCSNSSMSSTSSYISPVCNGRRRCRATARRRQGFGGRCLVRLGNSWTCAWQDWRSSAKDLTQFISLANVSFRRSNGPLIVKDDLGGQYETSFEDVEKHLLDYFTYKAVRTVLAQLSEMNPHQYAWFYNYVVCTKPQDSKIFLRKLVKDKQELGERVMVTRLHLFNKWIKKYNHAKLQKAIADENLELLRERLLQTVKFADTDLTDEADKS